MKQTIFNHICVKCQSEDELRFELAGPHVKAVCNHCRSYVKFFDKKLLPDVKQIRLLIWFWAKQDANLIERCKEEVCFVDEGVTGYFLKVQYWNLYLRVREIAKQENQNVSNEYNENTVQ
jgi:hypothetical protein